VYSRKSRFASVRRLWNRFRGRDQNAPVKPTNDIPSKRQVAEVPSRQSSPNESRFDDVLGQRRGMTDPRAALLRLDVVERELECVQQEARALHLKRSELSDAVAGLRDQLQEKDAELSDVYDELSASAGDLARARYALVRATDADPFPRNGPAVHHGVWTPGRPYLCAEHVYAPADGHCYRAPPFGIPAAREPGVSGQWVRCRAPRGCPAPVALPPGPHPAASGLALRQAAYWWTAAAKRWALPDLSDEHLHRVLAWINEHARGLWHEELAAAVIRVPCPAQAYADAHDWLADMPLSRALEEEVARRELLADAAGTTAATESTREPRATRRERHAE
jgi:hypothetical protein